MTKLPEGYELSGNFVLDGAAINRLVAWAFAPGEKVRLNPAFKEENVDGLFGFAESKGGELVIDKVIYDGSYITYKLSGFDEAVSGGLITDIREISHHYGVLFECDGEIWGVAFNDDRDEIEGCYLISGEPERHVAWNQGASSRAELIEYMEEGMEGEFVLANNGNDGLSLVSIPWSGYGPDEMIEKARTAVRELKNRMSLPI